MKIKGSTLEGIAQGLFYRNPAHFVLYDPPVGNGSKLYVTESGSFYLEKPELPCLEFTYSLDSWNWELELPDEPPSLERFISVLRSLMGNTIKDAEVILQKDPENARIQGYYDGLQYAMQLFDHAIDSF